MLRAMFFLSILLELRVLFAANIGSAMIGRVSEIKDLDQLTERSRRGNTYWAGNGSGFFVSEGGKIITNHHVIDGADEIVAIHGGIAYAMRVIKKNKKTDIALLEFDGLPYAVGGTIDFNEFKKPKFPRVNVRSREIKSGEKVTVVGYPHVAQQGLEAKVTVGVVSSGTGYKGDKDNFQMDAAISGGNSGGPVFDAGGKLVGISVAKFTWGENANYAIKTGVLKEFLGKNVELDCVASVSSSASVEQMIQQSVLILVYKTGARPVPSDIENERAGNEQKARFEKAVLYAQLLKVRKEWKELKDLTDGLIESRKSDDEIVMMNNIAREELGEHMVVFAEVDGADVKARIKPICGIRDTFVQCEEAFALDGGVAKRGFPVKAELSYYTPQGALWKGMVDEIYDWRGTKEIRVKLNKVIIK